MQISNSIYKYGKIYTRRKEHILEYVVAYYKFFKKMGFKYVVNHTDIEQEDENERLNTLAIFCNIYLKRRYNYIEIDLSDIVRQYGLEHEPINDPSKIYIDDSEINVKSRAIYFTDINLLVLPDITHEYYPEFWKEVMNRIFEKLNYREEDEYYPHVDQIVSSILMSFPIIKTIKVDTSLSFDLHDTPLCVKYIKYVDDKIVIGFNDFEINNIIVRRHEQYYRTDAKVICRGMEIRVRKEEKLILDRVTFRDIYILVNGEICEHPNYNYDSRKLCLGDAPLEYDDLNSLLHAVYSLLHTVNYDSSYQSPEVLLRYALSRGEIITPFS